MSEINPALAMQAYRLGRRIAGQRKIKKSNNVQDNEWPIEWNTLAVANNSVVGNFSGFNIVKISDLIPSGSETLSAIVTGDGGSVELHCRKSVTDNSLGFGVMVFELLLAAGFSYGIYAYVMYSENGFEGYPIFLPEGGTYFFMTNKQEEYIPLDAMDLQLKLSQGENA